ncbi:spermidine synthase [Tersicoccus solisilvae]|uniref:Spermidine synthase n=1 Tax=Tersicoccus solisilvae TaxID=1882339 RepID=A0ABQ1PBY4_9MICC|nr:fused MFS/spermidine synthase [Tersicoccus solisilvae]GGC94227.1 spermidine synthase [Tersicoccus solisilvae]
MAAANNPSIRLPLSGAVATIEPDGWGGEGHVLFIDGAEQSHVDLTDQTRIVYEYLYRISNVVDTLPTGPVRAIHLGAGAMTLPRYIAVTRPGSPQVVVDIEWGLLSFVEEHLPLPEGTDLQRIGDDARVGVGFAAHLLGGAADLVVLDVFAGADAPEHLTTTGFYREVANALDDDGVLAVNVGDDPPLTFFRSQASALLEVFDHVVALAEAPLFSGEHPGNLVLVASRRPLTREWLDARVAEGPHPAAGLDRDELAAFAAGVPAPEDDPERRWLEANAERRRRLRRLTHGLDPDLPAPDLDEEDPGPPPEEPEVPGTR